MIERDLELLAEWIDFPEEADMYPAIAASLASKQPWSRRKGLVVVCLCALVVAGSVAAMAVAPARSALLRLFHLSGATIVITDRLPEIQTGRPLRLGSPINERRAATVAGFEPLKSSLLGAPDEVTWDGRILWYRYGSVRLLVAQLRAWADSALIRKMIGQDSSVTPVRINGNPGLFVSGARHIVYLPSIGREGQLVFTPGRLARDVLIWQSGELTVRIEGQFSIAQGLRLARSLH